MVGRLEKVDLRKVWIKEAKDFTTWLENNLDILSEQLGFDLSPLEREKSAGTFSADIFAEGPNGETVVIENQLEKTDHDHLGKLITYLSNLEAKAAIWITSDPRPEHVAAINWLNEISPPDTSFFLVKVEAYRIGNSDPAPFFTAICAPSEEAKQIGEQKEHLAERHLRRLEFWKQLLDKAKSKTNLHSNVSPGKDNWVTAGAGKSGMGWSYVITMDKGSVELFIDRGPEKKDETDRIFEKILSDKGKIENEFGEPLIWDKVEGRRVCKIKSICEIGGLKDTALWDRIQEDMINRMVRLEKAFRPILSTIK
jgi:hypothetical protein